MVIGVVMVRSRVSEFWRRVARIVRIVPCAPGLEILAAGTRPSHSKKRVLRHLDLFVRLVAVASFEK
jgi:hypothetical protein